MAAKKNSPTDKAEATTHVDIEDVQDGEVAASDESAAPSEPVAPVVNPDAAAGTGDEMIAPAKNTAPSKLDTEYPADEPDPGRPPFIDAMKAKVEGATLEGQAGAAASEADILAAAGHETAKKADEGTLLITVGDDWPFNDIQSGGVVFAKTAPTEMPAAHPMAGEWKRNPYLDVKAKGAE